MNYLLVAPTLSSPTLESVKDLSSKVFTKVEKLLKKLGDGEGCVVKISVLRDGNSYKVNVELINHKLYKPFIAFRDADLKRAIGMAAVKLKAQILSLHNRSK